jgi:methionyl-tRNA synthetase
VGNEAFYVTTPIYYINARPHVGHGYTTVAADVLCRQKRLTGRQVLLATGTDEHGQKVATAAGERGQSPREFADAMAGEYQAMWDTLHVEYDRFIRTSEAGHEALVQKVFQRLLEQDDIHLGTYEGFYCVHEETYLRDAEVQDGSCPECGRPVGRMAQDCYFFRTSRYAQPLLDHLEANPEFIQPEARRNEVVSFVRGGLRDAPVSRRASEWDIAVPGNPAHTIYVWLDALLNYLTVPSYMEDDGKFGLTWPPNVQLMAKDIITRFHGTLWPAVLMALDLPLPDKLFVHGFWQMGEEKMSKSRANVVDPGELAEELSERSGATFDVAIDAIRYFLMREVPFGADGQFSSAAVVRRFNEDLANDLGNLLNRTLPLLDRYFDGAVPTPPELRTDLDGELERTAVDADGAIDRIDFSGALVRIWTLLGAANKYIDQRAPWDLHKAGRHAQLSQVLYTVADTIRAVATLVEPFMPAVAAEIRSQLGASADGPRLPITDQAVRLPPGTRTGRARPIFPRIDTTARPSAEGARDEAPEEGAMEVEAIDIEEFAKLDLRVGEIISAERVEGTDKLLSVRVDIGAEERTMVAGIAQQFDPAALPGTKVVVVANLKPAKIRGVVSQGMVLAAGDDLPLALVTLDRDCPNGTRVR